MRHGTEYHIQVAIAGREGVQEEYETNKREAIRKARRLTGLGGFGSAASVTWTTVGKRGKVHRRLLYQCTKVKSRAGREYVKVEEL